MAALRESFNERETELSVLNRTPVSFVIVGKPGAGKSTLAKRLAAVWKCQLVDGANTIEQILKEDSELAKRVSEVLFSGHELSEELVGEVIKEKLYSPEIQHYGYVLDCIPSYEETWKSISEQIEFLKSLPQPPDVIINLKIPDVDLLKRRIGQRVDPLNNEVFIRPVYDPDGPLATAQEKRDEEEDEEGEGGGGGGGGGDGDSDDGNDSNDGQSDNGGEDEFIEDLGEVDSLHLLAPTIADRLVKRAQDNKDTVEAEITHYKQNILSHIEDYIIQHNHQYVIELDANLSSKELFRSLLLRLTALGLPRAVAPKRLVEPDKEDEENTVDEPDPSEVDQFLTQVSETGLIIPKFRWRRSQWGLYCPVELARGNMVKGKLEFSVGLLEKMYCLSSAQALTAFIKCPRQYLVPPNPRIPCKICVLGPPTSGKTTLAKAIAEHYNATVIDVNQLMKPVLEQAMERNIKEAADKAKEETISKLMIEQEVLASSQKSEGEDDFSSPPPPPPVPEDHPDILAAIKEATEKAKMMDIEASVERYVEALSLGISQAEEKRREKKDEHENRDHGGWVVDGFPFLRDHWPFMEDAKVIPDFVVYFDSNATTDGGVEGSRLLMKRYCDMEGITDPYQEKETPSGEETESSTTDKKVKLPPVLEQWQKKTTQFESQWNLLSGAIKGLAIDPIKVSPFVPTNETVNSIVQQMEDVFKFTAKDLSGAEEEIDYDDDPILQEQDEEEEDDDDDSNREAEAKRRKPWGDSYHFCPVALEDSNVLWPGQPDYMVRYREKLYYCSSEEAKDKFMAEPNKFVADIKPLEAPSPRIFLLGPRASGKTVTGRLVAAKLGVFHVSFRDFLQDQIMSKMKYPPLQDPDMREEGDKEEEEGGDEAKDRSTGDDLDDDVNEPLTDKETELRAYLLHDEPLSEETLEEYTSIFWNTEPYKSKGFIMEGLPSQGDELRYLCSKGLYPDAIVILEVEEGRMLERVLPNKMNIWRTKRDKRQEKKRLAREAKLKEWENDKAERRATIEEEYKTKKEEKEAQKKTEEDEEDEGEEEEEEEDKILYEEYQEQLAEIEAEEPPEEEEEEEETEEDVEEKMKSALVEKYEEKVESMTSIQDVLNELLIPYHTVPANRKVPVVAFSLGKVLSRYFDNRTGILTKCTPIDTYMAKKLLDHGYKQLSKFGYWCPVQLREEPYSVLPPSSIKVTYPLIYRQRIYFTSSLSSRTLFTTDPESYLTQRVPCLPVPVSLAIVGPPKSGKTTLAQRFVAQYGCVRLSIGEAIRKFLAQFPDTDLTQQITSHLRVGQTVPEELCVLALERMLLDVTCSTRGYILDGWPITKQHIDLLNKYRIIPVKIVELKITNKCMLERAELFRQSTERTYPIHDSPSLLLSRSGHYHKHITSLREWYMSQHDNWSVVDGERNHWHVWRETHSLALKTAVQIQHYLIQIMEGQAASINCLCVTPQEFKGRLSAFGEYCPVNFTDKGQLVDCSSQTTLEYAVEYKTKYYRTAGKKELICFLTNPERYTDNIQLPSDLPCKRSKKEIKEMFPRQFEIQGFCPVTYVEGKKRYKALVPGNSNWSVEYRGKLYCCASEEKLEKFMKRPSDYIVTNLPVKLPPPKQPLSILSLPMLGYMEQSVATPIINSLTAVGCYKPKFPFLSATQSALIYVALHLKAYNPKSSTYVREKYRKKLQLFEDQCQLIGGLGEMMKKGYQEPHERPIDFESQMTRFLDLVRT